MKQYKINGHLITASTPEKAVKVAKQLDSIKTRDDKNLYKIEKGENGWTRAEVVRPDGGIDSYNQFYNDTEAKQWVYAKVRQYYGAEKAKKCRDSIKDYRVQFPSSSTKKENEYRIFFKYKDGRTGSFITFAQSEEEAKENFRKTGPLEKTDIVNIRKDSISDSVPEDVTLDFLISDEREAVEAYQKMIAKTDDPKLLAVLSHILQEETDHIKELENAKEGVYEISD